MKKHEDEVMPSVDKPAVAIGSTAVDKVVSETVGDGEGKNLGLLTEKDQGEDVMVDVVGSDAVEEDDRGTNLDGKSGSEELLLQKETETCEQVMEDVAGSGEDCDASVGIRIFSEKAEVVVNEEVAGSGSGSGEDFNVLVKTRVLVSEKQEVIVNEEKMDRSEKVVIHDASGSNGDIDVTDRKEQTERGLTKVAMKLNVEFAEEVADKKIVESSVLTANLDPQEVDLVVEEGFAEDSVSVDPGSVCANNQSSATEVVNLRTDEVDESNKEDNLHPTSKIITNGAQETIDGYCVEDGKVEKENEVLVSSKISENEDVDMVAVEHGLASKDEAQDEILVDPNLVCSDDGRLSTKVVNSATSQGETNVHAENHDQQAEVDNLCEKESLDPATENVTETVVMVINKAAGGLTKNKEIIEQPTEKTVEEDENVGSSKIPKLLTAVNLGPHEINSATLIEDAVENPTLLCEDTDMDRGEDAGMDVDEVLNWKDEVPRIDVTSGADKHQHFNINVNSEANVEQKLLESSSGPVLAQHREEYIKSREPIVYGRRVHVEVPLYESLDVEQKLPESSSPVSEDENLKIETDSEEEDDESVLEDEQKVDKQNSELLEIGNLFSLHQSCYFKPPENEGEFSVSDLVWGKVRSHPWWPGQIIDPSDASKKAMKYYKKDSFLVAYFGDHSFAWNNASVLKPFRANFSQNEKQINTEIFKTAVSCALEEVSRRVELGLACSCVPKEIYQKIEYQDIENGGVTKKSNKRHGKDESASVSSFEPDKLVDYVRLLAQFPDQIDKMDVAITKAQLSSYGRYKGYRELAEFLVCGDMLEDAPTHGKVEKVDKNGEKFENDLIELANPNKEISLSDITDDAPESVGGTNKLVSSPGLKKRKARVSIYNGSVKRPNRPTKVSAAPISTPKPSFKVGELIQRVASQLTGPVLKSGGDPKVDHSQHADRTVQTPENPQMNASVAEMLSQLHLTAQDPMKKYSFFQTIIPFFYERRAAVFSKSLKKASKTSIVEKPDSGTKRNPPNENDPEEFEFDFDFDFDVVNDSYWTDRIVQNHSEDQPLQDTQNGEVEAHPVVEHEPDKPAKKRRRSNKQPKRVISRDQEPEPEPEVEEESELVRKRRENLATEVVLKFEEGSNFCSEIQLNKMFRRFGPLMESETEVDRDGGRARVVFKKCSDAEVAQNSAGRFNIFGSINVSYELNYNPLVSYKPLPLPLLQEDHMDAS